MNLTEEQLLIKRLLDKDKAAASLFYKTFSPKLFAFIKRKIDNREDVEEITQDVLFIFLDKARDFTAQSRLSTYLFSIASNKIADFYRKKRLKKILFSRLPKGLEILISEFICPQKSLNNEFMAEKIGVIFKKIAPKQAKALYLKYIEGRSVKEVAKQLPVSFKACESIIYRARKAFIKLYEAE